MSADYCDRSTEIFRYAQLLQHKVMSGRIRIKPRVSRPGAVEALFAPTIYRSQFLPLVKRVSMSLTIGLAKMNQLHSLTNRLSSPHDTQLTLPISSLAHKLQTEIFAISECLQRVVVLSRQVLQEFSGCPQVSLHVRALVATQEYRLAELSMRLRDVMEFNKAMFTDTYSYEAKQTTPNISNEHNKISASTPRPPLSRHLQDNANLMRDGVIQLGDQPQLLNANAGGGVPHHQQQQMVVRQRDNAAAIRSTEATIVQLGEIYQQFSYLVKEQGDMVTRIDTNLDDGGLNVEYAHSQLVDFLRHLSSRRGFMLKFFVVLLLIFGLLVLIKR